MKLKLLALSLALVLAGCSSTSKNASVESAPITAINAQKLTTSFKRQGIKIEWECAWGTGMFGITDAMCVKGNIKAIEVTGYANSFGNSEALRERAFVAAEMDAKAKLVRFMNEGISTTNFSNTVTKNVEKAQDRIKNRIRADEEVAMSDEDAGKDTNFAVRENTNEVVRTLSESIRNNAEGKLRGAMVKEAEIVDRQTVKVTIRWDHNTERAAKLLRKRFSN
jgi:PBP1b-binding outer membrane lipoprotein LpoB